MNNKEKKWQICKYTDRQTNQRTDNENEQPERWTNKKTDNTDI